MRFHLLGLALTSFFFATPSLSSPSDILYIQKLTADSAINQDTKNFKSAEIEYIPTATYDPGNGKAYPGVPAIKKVLAAVVLNATTQTSLTTQSIKLVPPFDDQGAASTASAITYAIVTNLGQGADLGKAYVVYAVYRDQFVKTADFGKYGGWKYKSRVFDPIGQAGDPSVGPPSPGD